jgi:hypothetical protein
VLYRRSGHPLRRARSSAALTTKCDLKTRIRTHVSHGSATSGFLRQRCCRTMTFLLQNYKERVAKVLSGWVAVGYETLVEIVRISCVRVAGIHSKCSSKPLQTNCRDLAEHLQKNTREGRCTSGRIGMCFTKTMASALRNHCKPVAGIPVGRGKVFPKPWHTCCKDQVYQLRKRTVADPAFH